MLAVGETRAHSGEAASRSGDRPAGQPGEADRGDQGDGQAVRRRAVQRPAADARRRHRGRAGDPRGVVRGRPGRQRGRRRRVRQGQPGRQAARVVPAPRRPGADLLQPRARRAVRATPASKYNSRHRDIKSCDPQYVFGYGLSYSQFEISNLRLSRTTVSPTGKLTASDRRASNVAGPAGDEVVQLYLNDPVASISQPVRRLRGFERVTLAPGRDEDRHVHDRPQRLRLLRQRREVRRRAGRASTSTRATARRRR